MPGGAQHDDKEFFEFFFASGGQGAEPPAPRISEINPFFDFRLGFTESRFSKKHGLSAI